MNENYIELENINFSYGTDNFAIPALNDVSLQIERGQHIAVLGANGSGKSTLAKIISMLELPGSGNYQVAGIIPSDEDSLWAIRRLCAIVFQNPDNQIIGTTVEEDIAFGPENIGLPSEEIQRRVYQCAEMVGLQNDLLKSPANLSGGQKQKLAIAGVFAMEPRILILDESTSMLDPLSRLELLNLVQKLAKAYELTIINITHYMQEAMRADLVFLMAEGRVIMQAPPAKILVKVDLLRSLGLDVPTHTAIAADFFAKIGKAWQVNPVLADFSGAVDEVVKAMQDGSFKIQQEIPVTDRANIEQLSGFVNKSAEDVGSTTNIDNHRHSDIEKAFSAASQKSFSDEVVIRVSNLSYEYPYYGESSRLALDNVSFSVNRGEILGVVGHTGSGKSTLIQHLNGLIRAKTGTVEVFGRLLNNGKDIKNIRKHVGLLFQYPEHQLFAETVAQDIAYAPTKLGVEASEIPNLVRKAAELVGIGEDLLQRSPFELSGGQKRRVALAGVLAVNPQILILDEPAAALDPQGRESTLALISTLRKQGITVIIVSHSMEDVAKIADRVIVMDGGRIMFCDSTAKLFAKQAQELHQLGLTYPEPMLFLRALRKIFPQLPDNCINHDQVLEALLKYKEEIDANFIG